MAAKRVAPPKPKKPAGAKPKATVARDILKKRAEAKVMKKAGEQRRGMAVSRAKQQKGRLTAEQRKKVTDRDKQRAIDERYQATKDKFWY